MHTSKNSHLIGIISPKATKIFLKFCYFSILLCFLSCKSETPNKTQTNTESTTSQVDTNKTEAKKRIVVFGDSLTAGYGLDDVNNAFPGVIQKTIDSLGLDYEVVNSGVSGETTAGGKNRIDWILSEEPSIFILELGGNDGLRGVPLKETRANLQTIIDRVKTKYPECKIVLAGMQIPPNLGQDYTTEFRDIFPELAKKNDVTLIPFLLENVGGIKSLNQPDGIHPTKEGHFILAQNVWTVLEPLL
ncbi:MAG: arylesterase [Flavobacteriaceae bacterium]|nr:arylesterase [Flavobacteriaceae bacterium]